MAEKRKPKVKIDLKLARHVLKLVDKGLTHGMGVPKPGKMCVEAAVAYALGEDHTDEPSCVDRGLREIKISINDEMPWRDNKDRAIGMRRLAIAQLGSATKPFAIKRKFDERKFWDTVNQVLDDLVRRHLIKLLQGPKATIHQVESIAFDWDSDVRNIDTIDYNVRTLLRESSSHDLCEVLVQALIRMKMPGTKFLHLAPLKGKYNRTKLFKDPTIWRLG